MAKRRRNQQRPGANRLGMSTPRTTAAGRESEVARPATIRDKVLPRNQPEAPGRRRRVSRREREDRQKRRLLIGMTVAGALIALILVGFAANEYWFKPRHVMATVDGTKIRRSDYWKVRSYDLLSQAGQFQQLATFAGSDQQQQYQSLAQQALLELEDVWGSTDQNDATVSKMIDDQVYLKNLDNLGLSISQQDVDDYIAQQFEPIGAPIFTPTPTSTLIPTRAAWATETALAQEAEANAAEGTPEAFSSPVTETTDVNASNAAIASPVTLNGTPVAAEPASSPQANTDAAALASPVVDASTEVPTPTVTPNQDQARQTAAAGYSEFRNNAFDRTHLSRSDYERLIVRPAVARDKVRVALEAQVGQTADQVHAAHILVSTKDLADSIAQELSVPGANFEQIAKDQSSDTSTSPNGGDLGWFPRGIMVPEFDTVAFATQPGQISQPFQSEFGWHIIKVYEVESNRPLTDDQIEQLKSKAVQDWLDARKAETDIDSDVKVTPTPTDRAFEAPADAPPTPTLTPTVLASPAILDLASPQAGE